MPRCLLAILILFVLTRNAGALPISATAASPGEQCRIAIAMAERGHGVPPQLLASIGRVESGRRDPGTGIWGAWPWTINAEGLGSYFDTKAQAIQAVLALQARGVRSIDVGCMQVNLMHHPTAFPNLDMAFEPGVNADYAARFLNELHGQTGDWTKATADYHSANPEEGGPYAAKVISVWPEEQRKAGSAPTAQFGQNQIAPFPGPALAGLGTSSSKTIRDGRNATDDATARHIAAGTDGVGNRTARSRLRTTSDHAGTSPGFIQGDSNQDGHADACSGANA